MKTEVRGWLHTRHKVEFIPKGSICYIHLNPNRGCTKGFQ